PDRDPFLPACHDKRNQYDSTSREQQQRRSVFSGRPSAEVVRALESAEMLAEMLLSARDIYNTIPPARTKDQEIPTLLYRFVLDSSGDAMVA
ncbi:MAG: hypothetical protein INR71_12675, partial [Terriglobus roseus]|nr:hypothetical protein [Terriglobus roseus]